MKLIEIVLLMSAHCVSPVQQAQGITEAAKVQCAVVVEKDTETGEVKITPQGAAADERVVAALERLRAPAAPIEPGIESTVVPVAAPPNTSAVQARPAPQPEPEPELAPVPAPAVSDATVSQQAGQAAPDQTDTPPPAARHKNKLACKGGADPKWYTAANGRRKYRCVK